MLVKIQNSRIITLLALKAKKKAVQGKSPYRLVDTILLWNYIILARSGTIRSETILMILIIGLIAGPAVSL